MADRELSTAAQRQVNTLRWMLPLQARLQEITRSLGKTEGLDCLEMGFDNGAISRQLRRRGGDWHTCVRNPDELAGVQELVGDRVTVLEGDRLPFDNKTFDAVVVVDLLERVEDVDAFIEECHRILKPSGHLVLSVGHHKSYTLIPQLRRLLGDSAEGRGFVRYGYTESHLFAILKHGFDVLQVRTYSRFFVECVDVFARRAVRRETLAGDSGTGSHFLLGLLYRLAFQLDMLLFFTRGHALIATSKRRAWLPRKTPVLVDGRSISEAVLSKAID